MSKSYNYDQKQKSKVIKDTIEIPIKHSFIEGLKEKIIAKFSSLNVSVQKKLEKLQLDANNAEIDTSICPLYLSVFFLKGTTKNGDVVNAPFCYICRFNCGISICG